MRFNLAQLLQQPVGEHRTYRFDDPLDDAELALVEPVHGTAKLTRVNQGVLADVSAQTAIELECSRCLEPFTSLVAIRFAETYVPTVDVVTGLAKPATDVDPTVVFYLDANHNLDLREAIRQHTLLAVPMMPLHDPNCAGLCPVCGANLIEHGEHVHELAQVDERLQALSKLLATDDVEDAAHIQRAAKPTTDPRQP